MRHIYTGLLVSDDPWTGKTHSACPRPNSHARRFWPAASPCGSNAGPTERHYGEACWRPARRAGAPAFVLHDGPPYATAGFTTGTLLNKVLKDIIVRSQLLMGKPRCFVPGWDCHGPSHRAPGGKGGPVPFPAGPPPISASAARFTRSSSSTSCAPISGAWVAWACGPSLPDGWPRATRRPSCASWAAFARQGLLYRAKRPVHWWHHPRKRRWAEAEVEYADHNSPSNLRALSHSCPTNPRERLFGKAAAALVIWTTTPGTLAANLAVVANPQLAYAGVPVERAAGAST